MSHAWAAFLAAWHFFAVNIAPWLVVAGIPSLITALTPYPKAEGFVKGLKVALNLLSALSHADSPGTLKMPFTMSKPPADVASAIKTDGAKP